MKGSKTCSAILIGMSFSLTAVSDTGDEYVHKMLRLVTAEINKNAPFMVDSETRFDGSSSYQRRMISKYTIVNLTVSEQLTKSTKNYINTNMKNTFCSTPSMEKFRANNVSIEYIYTDKNGEHIASGVISNESCADE